MLLPSALLSPCLRVITGHIYDPQERAAGLWLVEPLGQEAKCYVTIGLGINRTRLNCVQSGSCGIQCVWSLHCLELHEGDWCILQLLT